MGGETGPQLSCEQHQGQWEPADLPGPWSSWWGPLELAGPAAPVPPFFCATWGVGQWSMVVAVLTLVLGVALPYAIRHHQRKDAQRDEQRKERTTALREILADVAIIEKTRGASKQAVE